MGSGIVGPSEVEPNLSLHLAWCIIANSLNEQCGHKTFQILGSGRITGKPDIMGLWKSCRQSRNNKIMDAERFFSDLGALNSFLIAGRLRATHPSATSVFRTPRIGAT